MAWDALMYKPDHSSEGRLFLVTGLRPVGLHFFTPLYLQAVLFCGYVDTVDTACLPTGDAVTDLHKRRGSREVCRC